MDFLARIEQSGFSTWVRESSSVWAYPTVLFMHTMGLGFLVGTSMAVDLRILGFSPQLPLQPMKRFFAVMWVGFYLNAVSGVVLVMIDARSMLVNPLFYIKLTFIALALGCGRLIWEQVFRNPLADKIELPMRANALAAASLVFWIASITAGRLTAYLFTHPGN